MRLACTPARVLASIIIALVCIAAVQPRAYAGEAVQRNYSDYLDRVEVPSEGSATFEGSTFGLTGFERPWQRERHAASTVRLKATGSRSPTKRASW